MNDKKRKPLNPIWAIAIMLILVLLMSGILYTSHLKELSGDLRTGIVVEKFYDTYITRNGSTKYEFLIVVESKTIGLDGKYKTTQRPFEIPYEDYLQIEIGDLVTIEKTSDLTEQIISYEKVGQ